MTALKLNKLLSIYTSIVQWSFELIFKIKLKLKSENKTIQYGRQAGILKVRSMKINRLLRIHTRNVLLRFRLDIQSQAKVRFGNWKIQYGHQAAILKVILLKINRVCPLVTLQWRHNGCDGVSNHQPRDCLLKCLFRRISKKTSKLRVTGLCAGISPGTSQEHEYLYDDSSNNHVFSSIQKLPNTVNSLIWLIKEFLCNVVTFYTQIHSSVRYLADDKLKYIFVKETCILIQIEFVRRCRSDTKSSLFLVIAWWRTCEKPIYEPIKTHFPDAYTFLIVKAYIKANWMNINYAREVLF